VVLKHHRPWGRLHTDLDSLVIASAQQEDEPMAEPNSDIPSPEEWEQWRRGMFGDPYIVWQDGPDFTALLQAARFDPNP
jgi:hypothetical protein